MSDEKIVGQVGFGTKIAVEVVDLGDDIEIWWADEPKQRIRVPKQSVHALADVLHPSLEAGA